MDLGQQCVDEWAERGDSLNMNVGYGLGPVFSKYINKNKDPSQRRRAVLCLLLIQPETVFVQLGELPSIMFITEKLLRCIFCNSTLMGRTVYNLYLLTPEVFNSQPYLSKNSTAHFTIGAEKL